MVFSQGVSADVGGWDTETNMGKEGWRRGLCDFLEMGSERKGRPNQTVSCRVWNEARMWVESQEQ